MSSTTSVPKATPTTTAPNPTPSQSDHTLTSPNLNPATELDNVDENGYPEQRHSGAVGYGPNYNQGVGFSEKLGGLKEQVKGTLTKNHDLKEEEQDLNKNDPFKTADEGDKKEESTDDSADADKPTPTKSSSASSPSPNTTSNPNTSTPNASAAFGTSNTSAPPQPQSQTSTKRDAQGQELSSGAPASATESGSGMKKPSNVKQIDESQSRTEPGDIAREAVGDV
ncbi:hypothetical protein BT96DRAFT_1000661 [Gymnopus androsaceus JB14]|uniref:Uncharacterized protein n=1 Tax=Gymnopus androsaceus JB14 TaxID=1447944 RepID=A0A6A4H4B0_9AGAR|nr:hypothetical protein BT96DRAFT_1000661 [Gymnopus androsaceus JB14]